jgi:hypothetical protein
LPILLLLLLDIELATGIFICARQVKLQGSQFIVFPAYTARLLIALLGYSNGLHITRVYAWYLPQDE